MTLAVNSIGLLQLPFNGYSIRCEIIAVKLFL